jgi:hypothetical protein
MRREVKEQAHQEFLDKFNQDERFHSEDLAAKQEANRIAKLGTEGYGALPGEVEEEPEVILANVVASINVGNKELKTYKTEFLKQQGKDQNWLDQQQIAWEKNPNAVDATISQYFNKVADKQRKIDADQIMINDVNSNVTKRFGTIDKLIPKNSPTVIYSTSSGIKYTYSPKDFVNFNSKFDRYAKPDLGVTDYIDKDNPPRIYDDELAKKELSDKEYNLYKILQSRNTVGKRNLFKGDLTLSENIDFYKNNVNKPYQKVIRDINDEVAKEVSKRLTGNQGAYYQIPTATPEQRGGIGNLLTAYAARADKQKGGVALSPEWNSETARALALDPEAKYNIKLIEGTSSSSAKYEIVGTGNAGTIRFNVTPQEKAAVFGTRFEANPAVQMIRPYQEQIRKTGGYTTANDGVQYTSQANGFLNKTDFPNIQSYGVKANIINPSPGNYQIRLAIYDPVAQKWNNDIPYPRTKFVSEEGLAPALITLSDAAVYELLNDVPASSTDLQKLKQANKKPL